jgi:SAM-dependent methyltransferase
LFTTTHAEAKRARQDSTDCPLCGDPFPKPWRRAPDRFHGRTEIYNLVRCGKCGLVRLASPPRPEEMPFHYDRGYHSTIETAGETALERRWGRQRRMILSFKTEGTLLDIGCSSGAFLRAMNGPDWQLHGVENSAEEADKARTWSGAAIFSGDPLEAPYRPDTFDVITCFHTLEHIYKPCELLRQMRTWLKQGGILYVIVPNIDSWEATLFGSYWYGLELPRHLFHFSPSSLERAARAARLKAIRIETADSFAEHSFHYLIEALAGRFGVRFAPLAMGRPARFPVKVVRKLFRVSAELAFRRTADAAGRGASIEGVFRKD